MDRETLLLQVETSRDWGMYAGLWDQLLINSLVAKFPFPFSFSFHHPHPPSLSLFVIKLSRSDKPNPLHLLDTSLVGRQFDMKNAKYNSKNYRPLEKEKSTTT